MSFKRRFFYGLIIVLLAIGYFFFQKKLSAIANSFSLPAQYKNFDIISQEERQMNFFNLEEGNRGVKAKIMVIGNKKDWPTPLGLTKIIFLGEDGYLIELPGYGEGLSWWRVGDFNGNGELDIAVMYESMGSASPDPFYFYEWNGENFDVKLSNRDEIFNEDKMVDLDNDGIYEIKHIYRLDKFAFPWEDIYKWDQQKNEFILANNLFSENYNNWLKKNNYILKKYSLPDDDLERKIDFCLTEKAKILAHGITGGIEECEKLAD